MNEGLRRFIGAYDRNQQAVRSVAGVVGVVSLAAAVAVAAGVGGPRVDGAVGALAEPARLFVYLFVHLAVALGLWSLWTARGDRDEEAPTTLPNPERRDDDGDALVGSDVDETLQRLADPTDSVDPWERVEVERAVREVAFRVLREEVGYEIDDLSTAIDEGTWTDDPRAAAYLGDADLPIRLRVIDWARGDPHRRRIDATVAELAAVAGVETEVEAP